VCIAAAQAGGTSQDLKTGFLVGATPIYQQIGLIIGVLSSSLGIGLTTLYLHNVMTVGSQALPAPQATLMATIIKGLLAQNLPWGLVLVGVFISVTLGLRGLHSLPFRGCAARSRWNCASSTRCRARLVRICRSPPPLRFSPVASCAPSSSGRPE